MKRHYADLLDMVNEMFADHFTVSEVTDALEKAGADISRASVGRYRLEWFKAIHDVKSVQDFAEMAVRGLADLPESKTARANVLLLEGGLFKAITTLGETFDSDPEKAIRLLCEAAKAQAMLARAARDDAEKTIKATGFSEDQAEAADSETPQTVVVEFVNPGQLAKKKKSAKAAKGKPRKSQAKKSTKTSKSKAKKAKV